MAEICGFPECRSADVQHEAASYRCLICNGSTGYDGKPILDPVRADVVGNLADQQRGEVALPDLPPTAEHGASMPGGGS